MSLNLITDPWIPVRCADGSKRIIAPWQMAEPGVLYPDWPRPDFNIACLELLIGLLYLADPPSDKKEWRKRRKPDSQRLKSRLLEYAPAFFLLGDGPRFLQDQEKLSGEPNPVDMLFIDSAGGQTMRNNIDVMVHRHRYESLTQPEAAMALYTLQDFAPSGGAGNRTSMRGGGPLVTLLDPDKELWDLVWFNVPFGEPSSMKELPWMRPTRTSEKKGSETLPPEGEKLFTVEAFFGMPRRLRLVGDEKGITGVIQKPYGTNYTGWVHPLSPYYNLSKGGSLLPKHPAAGRFGYHNWLGIIAAKEDEKRGHKKDNKKKNDKKGEGFLASVVREWNSDARAGDASVIVAGWAMNNMSPRDFIYSRQPLHRLSEDAQLRLEGFILAAEQVARLLSGVLTPVLEAGKLRDAQQEEFYLQTETGFLDCFQKLVDGHDPAEQWLAILQKQARSQFYALVLPGLTTRNMREGEKIAEARQILNGILSGSGVAGARLFDTLDLPIPAKKRTTA